MPLRKLYHTVYHEVMLILFPEFLRTVSAIHDAELLQKICGSCFRYDTIHHIGIFQLDKVCTPIKLFVVLRDEGAGLQQTQHNTEDVTRNCVLRFMFLHTKCAGESLRLI